MTQIIETASLSTYCVIPDNFLIMSYHLYLKFQDFVGAFLASCILAIAEAGQQTQS